MEDDITEKLAFSLRRCLQYLDSYRMGIPPVIFLDDLEIYYAILKEYQDNKTK